MNRLASLAALALLPLAASCGSDPDPVTDGGVDQGAALDLSIDSATDAARDASTNAYPMELAAWGLFEGSGVTQEPSEGVVPYDVISPLYSDDTTKHRFLRIPSGTQIVASAAEPWVFPVGTVLVKTFAYLRDARDPSLGERVLETRLLVREESSWVPLTYVWNDAQTAATRTSIGASIASTWIDSRGASHSLDYRVPNTNQCKSCHGGDGPTAPLGPRTRQLDRAFDYGAGMVNQIDHLQALGWLTSAPASEDRERLIAPHDDDASLDTRARSYLDSNCAHCHREGGAAHSSGLWLDWPETDPVRLGICKRPPAAGGGSCGLTFDIVPGRPDLSILVCRVASDDPAVKMPELPQQLVDPHGLALLTEWIAAMPAGPCTP